MLSPRNIRRLNRSNYRDVPFEHFDRDFRSYSDELPFGWIPSNRNNIDPTIIHYDRRQRTYFPEPRITEIDQRNMDGGIGSYRTAISLPFGRAMRALHERVEAAEQFYSNFQSEYDNEITSIKKYATDENLRDLWGRRIKGKKDQRIVMEGEDKEDDEALRELRGSFEDNGRELLRSMLNAVNSSVKDESNKSSLRAGRYDDAKRMIRKVNLALTQIGDLLDNIGQGRHKCASLLHELSNVKDLVDPQSEQNKVLFRSSKEYDDDFDSMAGNDGRDDD